MNQEQKTKPAEAGLVQMTAGARPASGLLVAHIAGAAGNDVARTTSNDITSAPCNDAVRTVRSDHLLGRRYMAWGGAFATAGGLLAADAGAL